MEAFEAEVAGQVGRRIRKRRRFIDMSQEELAFRSAIHRTQISLLESGHRMPRVETLVKLAGSLGATPDDLLDGIAWEPIEAVTGGMVVRPPKGGQDA